MKATGILVVAVVVLVAGCGADTARTAGSAGSTTPATGDPGTSASSADGSVADAHDTRVRIVQVEGAPPFYVEVGMVEPVGGDGVWGQHDLHVISEWRSPVTVAGDDVVVDLTGTVAAEGKLAPEKTVTLQPQDRITVTVTLVAEGNPDVSGQHRVQIQLPFWRDGHGGDQAARGAPDDVATVILKYEIPTVTQLAAIEPFCAEAVPAVQAINEIWQDPGQEPISATRDALEPVATAARGLDDPRASPLLEAIEALREDLNSWQDQDTHSSGFSTHPVVDPINELCGTDLHSSGITG